MNTVLLALILFAIVAPIVPRELWRRMVVLAGALGVLILVGGVGLVVLAVVADELRPLPAPPHYVSIPLY